MIIEFSNSKIDTNSIDMIAMLAIKTGTRGKNTPYKLEIEGINEVVCNYFGITSEEVKIKSRDRKILFPRQMAMFFCCRYTIQPFQDIGRFYGGKDHATVIHSRKVIQRDFSLYDSIKLIVSEIDEILDKKSKGLEVGHE